jgi:ubiquinol-cytochrome c reductase core subunit 2
VREAELLGATLNSYHSRENIVLEAKFLRDDLPYFVELLGEVAGQTKYLRTSEHRTAQPSTGGWN